MVRSAVYVDPVTQATTKSDPLPQLIEGIPLGYRTLHVAVDRPGFTSPHDLHPGAGGIGGFFREFLSRAQIR